jgi:SAM-dependent methyltransferase
MTAVPLYDDFSENYDRFVNWHARLALEMPFFRELFQRWQVRRILDVACGTGQHAIAFAREGYEVTATDLSKPMIQRARAAATQAGVKVNVARLGFGELARGLAGTYDAITCLGNSLPHLTTDEALLAALQDMCTLLAGSGVLVIQNRNFDRVLASKERFMPPEVHVEGDREWLFLRFYDFRGDLLRFNVLRLQRTGESGWSHHMGSTQLRAWDHRELSEALPTAGLRLMSTYGSYRGEDFDPLESGDLVIVASRSASAQDPNRQ